MRRITCLDEHQCAVLRGGSMSYTPYSPKGGYKNYGPAHVETVTHLVASTVLGQANSANNFALALGGMNAQAVADSMQANSAVISTVVVS